MSTPQPGETWKRCDGGYREVVRIESVRTICNCKWTVMHDPDPSHDAPSVDVVRCQPVGSDRHWFTTVPEFVECFEHCPPGVLHAVADLAE